VSSEESARPLRSLHKLCGVAEDLFRLVTPNTRQLEPVHVFLRRHDQLRRVRLNVPHVYKLFDAKSAAKSEYIEGRGP
jgi:hypothetical protein